MPKFDTGLATQDGLGFVGRIYKHLADKLTLTPERSTDNVLQAQTATAVPFVVRRFSSGATSDLLQIQDETGAVLGGFGSSGSALGGSIAYIDACGSAYGASPSATAAANSTAIQNAINDAALLRTTFGTSCNVLLSIPGQYAIGTGLQMKSNVVLMGVESEWSVWSYNSSPQNFQTTSFIADGTAGAVVTFATTVHDAGFRNVLVVANGRAGISLPATTNRNGNRLRNVYVTGASTGLYVGAAETRMENILVLLSTGDGVQIDGLDCQLDTLLSGFNGGNGVVVGSTGAQNANVLRGHTWDVFDNTLDGIQLNGAAHRLLNIQSNNNGNRGIAFLTCVNTMIGFAYLLDNGTVYDGVTHLTRYPDVEFAHPTGGNLGCGIVGGAITASVAGVQSFAVHGAEAVVSFANIIGVAFSGSYQGGNAPNNYVSSINNFRRYGCLGVPDFVVPQGGFPGITTRANGSADQLRISDGSGNGWAGFRANGSLYKKFNTLSYSTSITPDASNGNYQKVTATDAVAFTINAPTSPPGATQAQELTIEVHNSSGGVMGAITWNAVFVFQVGAWVNPAAGKSRIVRFEWNGANWIQTSPVGADF